MSVSLRILFWSLVSQLGWIYMIVPTFFSHLFLIYVTFGPNFFWCGNYLSFLLFVDLVPTETWIFADKMKKNHINLFTTSLFTWSIYEIIYAALFKDYLPNLFKCCGTAW